MLLPQKIIIKKTKQKTIKQKRQKPTTKQTKTAATYNNPCLHHGWRCYQEIPLNDQQLGPTSLALLSP